MPALIVLILLSYPVVVHLSIYLGNTVWAVYYLAMLFALPLPYYLIQKRRLNWLVIISTIYSILIFLLASNQPEILLFAQPIIINSILFLLVVSTLFGNSVPLICRLTLLIRPDAPDEVLQYSRWVTWAWALFFLTLAIVSWVLSVYASIETWSWFTNVLAYILVGAMFVAEFLIRRVLMRNYIDRSFIQFIRDLRQVDYRQVVRGWRS